MIILFGKWKRKFKEKEIGKTGEDRKKEKERDRVNKFINSLVRVIGRLKRNSFTSFFMFF